MRHFPPRDRPGGGPEATVRHLSSVVAFLLLTTIPGTAGTSAGGGPPSGELSFFCGAGLPGGLPGLAPPWRLFPGGRRGFNFGASNDLARSILAAGRAA